MAEFAEIDLGFWRSYLGLLDMLMVGWVFHPGSQVEKGGLLMRRSLFVVVAAVAALMLLAAPAWAAHCQNLSKPDGAGNHTDVVINAATGEATISGLNGGWASVWLDVDGDGVGDVLLEEGDVQIGKNHSPQQDPENPWVNPGATNKALSANATHEHGMLLPSD